ncbi:MAG TPA: tripartite tricarboxylate transporter substrate binding protein [Thermodesulfobacteriota bacterium]|nr:tripartite tricarboxylate transporter substrate binding protein [Thermodesulfobacteriota bacterium]
MNERLHWVFYLFQIFPVSLIALGMGGWAGAQDFPSRPVEVIVGFAPGGGTDLTARAVANHATKYFGQPFIVVNKAGAAGTIASQYVAAAKPDGYTLLTAGGSETTTAGHFRKLPFHPLNDFEPVICIVGQQIGLSVKADTPWKTIQEFIADAKRSPERYSYATSGIGSLYHAAVLVLEMKTGIKLRHVPFKGGAETLSALLGGHVDVAISAPDEAYALIEGGRVRSLVTFSNRRSRLIPNVPTLREVGYGFFMENMKGFVGPKGIPKPIIQKIHDGVKRMMNEDPGFKDSLDKVNLEMNYLNSEDFGKALRFMYDQIGGALKK